jgi:hypothetical protein
MTMADPIRDNLQSKYAGHTWTPGDFKQETKPELPDMDGRYPDAHGNWHKFEEIITTRQAILDEARDAITGEREDAYGGPEQSFTTIAKFWSAYLDRFIETQDVAAMLALLKIARIKHSEGQHRDSWVDLAGYAACGAECALHNEETQ